MILDRKIPALPSPPRDEATALGTISLSAMLEQRSQLIAQAEALDSLIEDLAVESICGGVDDLQEVESYEDTEGVSKAFVREHESKIGQLQWRDNLANILSGPGESPGNVSGERWGSGGLISNDLYVTAGHCFDVNGGGWIRPSRNSTPLSPFELAKLMIVNFNFQIAKPGYQAAAGTTSTPVGGNGVRTGMSFPVLELLEYRNGGLDYAIVRLGTNGAGQLPGQLFGTISVANQDLTTQQAMLCLIQHPNGRPKQVEVGPLTSNIGSVMSYDSLDTLGGSSGSPILAVASGQLVGVHTNGGCSAFSGANKGVAIGAIRQISSVI